MALNRTGISIILLCGSIYGQSVTVEGVTATQAKISVAAENVSLCTIKLSKSTTLTPLVYDLDGALFTNAQNAHVLTGAGVAGKREILIGQRVAAKDLNGRWDSRALATNTQYFGEASVCVTSPVTFNFTTGVTHGSGPQGYPIDSTAWGNQAFPEFDFTDLTKPVVDPQTGIEIYSADPSQWSSNTALPVVSGYALGGTGWTNFSNIISYSSAVATTGNTNTATLLINTAAYSVSSFTGGGNWPYDNILDIGLELYGSGSDASATNRTVRACLTVDSQTCFTDYVTIQLKQTTDGATGCTPVSACLLPNNYPATYFRGWSKRLPRKKWVQTGYVTASAGTITLYKDADGAVVPGNRSSVSYFDPDWVAGTKLWIPSAACSTFCTVAAVQSGTQLTTSESATFNTTVTAISKASPAVMTAAAHGLRIGTYAIQITGGPQISISSCTNANPAVCTATAHGLPAGTYIMNFSGASSGWTAMNANISMTQTGANTFSVAIDSTAFGAFPAGVVVNRQLGGIALPVSSCTNANPTVCTATAHGLPAGTYSMNISGGTGGSGSWADINGNMTITQTGANTFSIPVNATGFGSFPSTVVINQWNLLNGLQTVTVIDANTFSIPVDSTNFGTQIGSYTFDIPYSASALGVIINKTNATGTVNVSARFRIAQGWPNDIWTGGCASTTVTSGDGITGYPCVFPKVRQDSGALYFVGVSTPVIRLISLFPNRGCSPCNVADSPNGAISVLGPTTPGFDPADPSYMYTTSTTNSAGPALFKAHYTGNWSALNISYTSSGSNPPVTTELSWENMTRSETAHDISTQVLANTTYNATIFPALTGVIQAGYSNGLIFYTIPASGQDTAGWIFAFTASTGNFYRAWNTYDGVGVPELKYGGLHAGSPIDDGGILASLHLLTSADAAIWLGGPFKSTIATVKKAGVFNANTSLPWPPDSTYDQTCPMAYPNGTDGCFTFRAPSPCSVTPHTGEAAIYACDHGSGLSMISTYTVGDWFKAWLPSEAGSDRDAEGFKVVQVTDLGGGNKEVVAWRNAPYSYCAIGKDGVNGAAQNVHSNGWVLFMTPAEACAAGLTLVDSTGGSTGLAYPVNNQSTRGHFAMAKTGTKQSTLTGIGGSGDIYGVEYQRAWSNILQRFDFSVPTSPKFSGASSAFATQSYADAKQFNANADLKRYVFDFRHFNGNTGLELEYPGQTIGTATAAALQGGTTSVYKVTVTGTVDVKRGQITAWAGDTLLRDISNATTSSHQITDATPWRWCYAYNAGECRTGSSQGDFYMSVPGMTSKTSCWASQINLRVLCAMTGPVQATNATQVLGSQADPDGINQRLLGHILMGPGHQYVYSNLLATPAAEYLMFGGYLTSGYHTALMMAKLPPYNADSNTRNQFIPIKQIGTCTSCYIRFGYQEFGDPLTGQFYATSRAEETRVAASAIVAATPFKFASEALSAASGSYTIQIPALPGFTLFWQLVDNGVPGALNSVLVN